MTTLLDIGAMCARWRAASLDLFEQLGAWVPDTPPGAQQQRWATACHVHAWHAELWAQRAPTIRPFDLAEAVAAERAWIGAPVSPGDRAVWYRRALDRIVGELDEMADEVDPLLDPATVRTVALVRADLVGLPT